MDDKLHADLRTFGESHWWYEGRRRVLEAQLSGLGIPQGASILDIGCGSGAMLPTLARFGTVRGIETDPAAVAHCNEVHGHVARVDQGRLPDALWGRRDLDLITAFDVLEHVADDTAMLLAVEGALRPGGRLMATVPAFPSLWGPQDVLSHHHRRYRAATLTAAFEGTGLRIDRVTHFNFFLFPPIALLRWGRRLVTRGDEHGREADELGSDFGVGPTSGPVPKLLESVFAAERHLLRFTDLPFGVSLLVTATRI